MKKITVIGSGNFGSCIARLLAYNVQKLSEYDSTVNMWVYEETVSGENLTKIINRDHENVKYLPGVKLPETLKAVPDLIECVKDADILVFVVPHQFVEKICVQIKPHIKNKDVIGVSLIKGVIYKEKMILITKYISEQLNIDVSVLMGANIASEMARDCLSEGTIGYNCRKNGETLKEIFHCKTYKINLTPDVPGVEISGTIKNIIAIGYGIANGLKMGSNTTAAIFRRGIVEQLKFLKLLYPESTMETYFESSGVADLLVSCLAGRNYRCGFRMADENKSVSDVEADMGGQKLQGTLSAAEVYNFIKSRQM